MDTWKAEPCGKHVWEQHLRVAALPIVTKGVAFLMATYSNGAGANVRPSIELVMQHSGLSERAVREHLSTLRNSGWLILVTAGSGGRGQRPRAAVYRLSYPAEVTAKAPSGVHRRAEPSGE
ncbi:MAG: hypothetical protein EPO40_02880 [Myxococcaceae bacterium]|nr:MAG: hypothetical protein EPO40_02880 [Myxococcaceae bacterium]